MAATMLAVRKARPERGLVVQEVPRPTIAADEVLVPIAVRLGYRTEPPASDPERQAAREADGRRSDTALAERFAALSHQLEDREYFCGGFSVADIAMFIAVLWTQRLGGPGLRVVVRSHDESGIRANRSK